MRSGEFEWIARYLSPLAAAESFGLLDDAAMLSIPAGRRLAVTQDAIVENIHFLSADPPDLVARKALRVNISDIVAKGASPLAYSLALGVPDTWRDEHMAQFANGLETDQRIYGIELTGGDTFRSPERLTISVTLFGHVDPERYRSRAGANVDDCILVSGTIGDAALGLKHLSGEFGLELNKAEFLQNAYRLPEPPARIAGLVAEYATASMDISDGLIGDCRKLCDASGVSATLERSRIPLSEATQVVLDHDNRFWTSVLTGGDDYQVLCTVSPDRVGKYVEQAEQVGIQVTQIGVTKKGQSGNITLDIDGVEVSIDKDSYSHF